MFITLMRTALLLALCGCAAKIQKNSTAMTHANEARPTTGAENVRWDLSVFYSGIDDPQIEADLRSYEHGCVAFRNAYKGKLSERLSAAITAYGELSMLGTKIGAYLQLRQSTDLSDAKVKSRMSEVGTRMASAAGEYLTFFELELVDLDGAALERLKADPVVAKHWPWIMHARSFKPHVLSEAVETALAKRSPFGPGSWGDFFDEVESDLRFPWGEDRKTLIEMLHLMTESADAEERFRAMTVIDEGFKGAFEKYAAYALWMTSGSGNVEDKERGYAHPMRSRNMGNRIPDEVVEALHAAMRDVGGPLCRRYYRLKAAHLGKTTLRWSDRNAKMPFSDEARVPFDEAKRIVIDAYASLSPTMADLARQAFAAGRVDAPMTPNRQGGAYNMSVMLPGEPPMAFTFMTYLGSARDVMTLAHELGHGVHGVLAGEAQGPLMFHAPMAYAETASVFGEMTTFNALRAGLLSKGDKKALLALVMGKLDDMMNTQVRQISFSNFERRFHAANRRLSPEEMTEIWLGVTQEMYGPEGEVFTYEHAGRLWAYISHFYRPFYVYAYAIGDLLTQSIYAKRAELGDRFEPLYLDLLRAGSTKDALELLRPFGLDPSDPAFWKAGIEVGMKAMLEEAEWLSAEAGVRP